MGRHQRGNTTYPLWEHLHRVHHLLPLQVQSPVWTQLSSLPRYARSAYGAWSLRAEQTTQRKQFPSCASILPILNTVLITVAYIPVLHTRLFSLKDTPPPKCWPDFRIGPISFYKNSQYPPPPPPPQKRTQMQACSFLSAQEWPLLLFNQSHSIYWW